MMELDQKTNKTNKKEKFWKEVQQKIDEAWMVDVPGSELHHLLNLLLLEAIEKNEKSPEKCNPALYTQNYLSMIRYIEDLAKTTDESSKEVVYIKVDDVPKNFNKAKKNWLKKFFFINKEG